MLAEVLVPQEPIPDDKSSQAATEEARHLQEGDLEQQARRHRSSRMQHMHWIGICCLWAAAVVGVVVAVVGGMCLWHLVTPSAWHLLEAAQVSRLNTIAVTFILSSLVTFVVQQATR